MVKVLIKKLDPKVQLPIYKTEGSSGMDLMAFTDKPIKILPNSSFKIQIKTISKVETISLPFNILNVVTGLRKSLSLDFDLKLQ